MKKFLLLILVLGFLLGLCVSCDMFAPVAGDDNNAPTENAHDVKVFLVGEDYKTSPYSPTNYTSYLLYDAEADQYHFISKTITPPMGPGEPSYNYAPVYDEEAGTEVGNYFDYDFVDLSGKVTTQQSYTGGETSNYMRVAYFYDAEVKKYRECHDQNPLGVISGTLVPEFTYLSAPGIHGTFFFLDGDVHMIPYDNHSPEVVLTKLNAPNDGKLSIGEYEVYAQNWWDSESSQVVPWKALTYTYKYEDPNGDIFYFNEKTPVI